MASVFKWGITDRLRLAQTVGKVQGNYASCTTEEFIDAAERAKIDFPNEWVIYYTLGDKYQSLGFYAQGLIATQKCVELRPNDIRSTYALATAYNLLTLAAWSEKEEETVKTLQAMAKVEDKLDRRYSQAGLDHTGLTIETAAVQAIRWFERCLMLRPDSQSREQIKIHLRTLYRRFPHLRK